MAAPPAARYLGSMIRIVAAVLLALFGAFSLWVAWRHGYFGFLSLARAEPWALQMLLDLAIALSIAIGWLRADARRRSVASWPYIAATVALGSLGVLAYLVLRPPRET